MSFFYCADFFKIAWKPVCQFDPKKYVLPSFEWSFINDLLLNIY